MILHTFRTYAFLQRLRQHVRLAPEALRLLQNRLLKDLVRHAGRHVPFYRDYWREMGFDPSGFGGLDDLSSIPVVTADRMREALVNQTLLTDGVRPEDCFPLESSASSGSPIQYLKLLPEEKLRRAGGLLIMFEHGFKWSDITVQFQGYAGPSHPLQRFGISRKHWIRTVLPIEQQATEFVDAKPDFVLGPPKALRDVSRCLEENRISLLKRPKVVFGAGEYIDVETRRVVNKVMGSDPIGVYGQTEVGFSMWQCERREGFHVSASTHLVEVLADGHPVRAGEMGTIVTTDLAARTMPVIRYDSRDLAIAANGPCGCGRTFPVVASIEGRESGMLNLPGDAFMTTPRLVDRMAAVLRIGDYRIYQSKSGALRLEMKRNATSNVEKVREHLRRTADGLDVEVQIADPWRPDGLTKTHTVFKVA